MRLPAICGRHEAETLGHLVGLRVEIITAIEGANIGGAGGTPGQRRGFALRPVEHRATILTMFGRC